MLFSCKACSAALQKEDIDFETGIASCAHCHAVMSFAQEMGLKDRPAPPPPPAQTIPARPWAPQPKSIEVEDTAMALRFKRRWFSPVFFFLLFFCVIWNGFLVGWYAMTSNMGGGPFGIIFMLFPLIHVAVGIGLTYYVICGFVNRTVISVNESQLSVVHEPLPWRGNKSLNSRDLKQLYCVQKISHSKNGTSISYNLNAILKNGEKEKLLGGLTEQDTAIYLEQQIEKRLGIKDERVAGDVV